MGFTFGQGQKQKVKTIKKVNNHSKNVSFQTENAGVSNAGIFLIFEICR